MGYLFDFAFAFVFHIVFCHSFRSGLLYFVVYGCSWANLFRLWVNEIAMSYSRL